MQDWRDGFRAFISISKAFFAYLLFSRPEVIIAILPITLLSIFLDIKATRDFSVLKLEDGEILIPSKPRMQRILGYSLLMDLLMLVVLLIFVGGYDSVILTNTMVFYSLYLFETSAAKVVIEAYRPELEKTHELWVENEA
ncbi:MAG: hypothetical protein GOU98_01790 [Candidatus Altiarchaeota archaeon]|nr:hypothetical protein [Candidatus Altiarchaeota archaeon]